jgi:hypothetical protein
VKSLKDVNAGILGNFPLDVSHMLH